MPVTLTITVINSGVEPVTGVEAISLLPIGLDLLSVTPTAVNTMRKPAYGPSAASTAVRA